MSRKDECPCAVLSPEGKCRQCGLVWLPVCEHEHDFNYADVCNICLVRRRDA